MFKTGQTAVLKKLGNRKLRQEIKNSSLVHKRMAIRQYRKLKINKVKVEKVYKEERVVIARLPDGFLLKIPFEALMHDNFKEIFNKLDRGEE